MDILSFIPGKGLRQFLIRTALFMAFFVIISMAYGPLIVNTTLLYRYGFFVYGGLGGVFIFITLAFAILVRKRLASMPEQRRGNTLLCLAALLAAALFYALVTYCMTLLPYLASLVLGHLLFILTFVLLAIGIYGIGTLRYFISAFKRELVLLLCLAVLFYCAMFLVWKSWDLLSSTVSQMVYWMLARTVGDASYIPPRTIKVGDFAGSIEQACSGVYSMFLFSCLYLLLLFLDWKEFNKKKAAIIFPMAIVGLFFVNILRIYMLFVMAVYVSPEFARDMFHSYIGMVLFLIYFIGFLFLFYRWLKK